MNKDIIKQKISGALSASLAGKREKKECWCQTGEGCGCQIDDFNAGMEKRESEIKSALETIDWGDADENLGMNVYILYKNGDREIRNNVTEIHYNFPSVVSEEVGDRVAFESDVHGTGGTVRVDTIQEFEAVAANKKEKEY